MPPLAKNSQAGKPKACCPASLAWDQHRSTADEYTTREGQAWRSHSPHGREALRNASPPCGWEMAIARRLGSAAVSQHGTGSPRLLTTYCLTCRRSAQGAALACHSGSASVRQRHPRAPATAGS